ncbi:MAG: cysteine desulfurase [Proteobacteria bacterium]|nr:cysteine desulfurase [Pseudomonadota bacterium]
MNRPENIKTFDIETVRADFPILADTVYGKPLTFLDSAASAQKPKVVIDTVAQLYSHGYANIHRGMYKLSQEATEAYEQTRFLVREFINAASHKECLFVRNATEGINLVAQSYGRTFLSEGDEIILTELEHHSNIVPWQLLREEKGIIIKVAPISDEGEVDLKAYRALLTEKTKLVALAHISNVLGTILPVKEMIALAHQAGAKVLVDGCQAAPHIPIDVQDLDADFYVFSGHKVYGPTGVGVLYGKKELLEAMPPWQGGGDMIELVTFEKTTFNVLPQKFEAGTPNIAGVIGLGAALDYINQFNRQEIEDHEHGLLAYALGRLRGINQLKLIGTAKNKASIISFVLDDIHPHDAGTILDQEGIAVRTGHHCAQPLMERFGLNATIRASFGLYNTRGDVDRLAEGLKKTREIFA